MLVLVEKGKSENTKNLTSVRMYISFASSKKKGTCISVLKPKYTNEKNKP